MILARLSQAVRTQNWFAVVVEFVVVVAGVVIGFAVTGWAETRNDDRRADLYLERLSADMEENQRRYIQSRDFRSDVRAFGLEALAYTEGRRTPETPWRVILAYFNASQAGGSELVAATYGELIATGDLRLLQNSALRGRLSSYYSQQGLIRITDELPAYRESVRGEIPIELQNYIWANCYETMGGRDQAFFDCDAPADFEVTLSAFADQLVTNTELTAELRYWVSTQFAALELYSSRIALTRAILEELQAEIATRR
ncbi:hypothetical protein [Hyphobacterium sp.]|uniref:hypothetical protein n=1 Tax=Hyphobacterium sp. TaxID=2004662 RepID=UPI003B522436